MIPRNEQERQELIIRQFRKFEAYFAERGVSRRQLLRMIASGSAAATVLPILVACGEASDDEVDEATQPPGGETPAAGGETPATGGTAAAESPATGSPSTGGQPSGEGQQGGTILIGTLGEAQSINPILTNETEGTWRCKMMFDEFIELDPETLAPRPNLAKEWQISDDGLEYTFTLQDNIMFSDGEQLTAEDIEFTVLAILAPDTASPYLPRFTDIVGAEDYNAGTADAVEGLQVVDDMTIKMVLATPNAAFITNLQNVRPLPKHLLDGKNVKDDPFFQAPVGAGPFKFVSWQTGQDFVAERNPNYWQEGLPYLDGFTHRVIADSQTLVVALETGEIEGSAYALPTQADVLKAKDNLVVLTRPFDIDDGWGMSSKNNEALADKRVRQAIVMAIDIETYASDFLLGLGAPALGPVSPANWAHDPNLTPLPYDPEQAKALLEEAGVSDLTVRLTTNAGNVFREDWVTFTQDALSQIGVNVQPDVKEWTQVVKEGTEGTFELICPVWCSATIDPDELYLGLHTGEARNVYGYSNPELDTLLEEGRQETDIEKRKEIYSKVQQMLIDDAPIYWAWYRPFIDVTTTAFEGYQSSVLGFFQELEYWYRKA